MQQYVADTHSIVWYFTDDPQLSENALKAFDQTTENGLILIPTIVLAEIIFIAQKGRITLIFWDTLKRIEEYENFEIAPLDIEVLKTADKIQTDTEIHDKIIIATAQHYDAFLISKDKQITESGIVQSIW